MFKKKLKCNQCNKSISNREINIDAINNNKVLFRCECSNCQNQFFAEVSILNEPIKKHRQHQGLKLKAKKQPTITSNDILDVKNFLKSFKGDFKEIFKK